MMLAISLKSIPHNRQRYDTCGDWWFDGEGTLQVRVSKMSDWRQEFLVGVHEIIEAMLCKHNSVKQQDVDAFDKVFERNREEGDPEEPGDSPQAPYHWQHGIATGVERILAVFLNVPWHDYERELYRLDFNEKPSEV